MPRLKEPEQLLEGNAPALRLLYSYMARGRRRQLPGEPGRARDLFTRSTECSQRCGWQQGEAYALVNLGPVRALCGDPAGAAEACDRALTLARLMGDPWLEACALFRSAFTAGLSGELARAKALAIVSVALSPKTGDRRLRAFTLMTIGQAGLCQPGAGRRDRRQRRRGSRAQARPHDGHIGGYQDHRWRTEPDREPVSGHARGRSAQ